MDITPTVEQQALIRDAVASGRLHQPEEAIKEALSLWEERERRRLLIVVNIDQAQASLERGEGRTIDSPEKLSRLAEDIKRRGQARLTDELNVAK